jgi:hypothetical protein
MNVSELKQAAENLLPADIAAGVKRRLDDEVRAEVSEQLDSPSASPQSLATFFIGDRFYGKLRAGRFVGVPTLKWDGPDSFIFMPDASQPFYFERADGRKIQPTQMQTDGGSIPYVFRALSKFSPWSFGPAFIIHDWLFVAHKRGIAPDTDWTLDSSAIVMAECIKTLMTSGFVRFSGSTAILDKNEDTLFLMYLAVKSIFADSLWNKPAEIA